MPTATAIRIAPPLSSLLEYGALPCDDADMAERADPGEFGEWFRAQYVGRGFSRRRLSKESGVSDNTLQHMERGYRKQPDGSLRPANPDELTLHRVAEALGIPEREMCERAGLRCSLQVEPVVAEGPNAELRAAVDDLRLALGALTRAAEVITKHVGKG